MLHELEGISPDGDRQDRRRTRAHGANAPLLCPPGDRGDAARRTLARGPRGALLQGFCRGRGRMSDAFEKLLEEARADPRSGRGPSRRLESRRREALCANRPGAARRESAVRTSAPAWADPRGRRACGGRGHRRAVRRKDARAVRPGKHRRDRECRKRRGHRGRWGGPHRRKARHERGGPEAGRCPRDRRCAGHRRTPREADIDARAGIEGRRDARAGRAGARARARGGRGAGRSRACGRGVRGRCRGLARRRARYAPARRARGRARRRRSERGRRLDW